MAQQYQLTIWRKAGKTIRRFNTEAEADQYIDSMSAEDYAAAVAFYIEPVKGE